MYCEICQRGGSPNNPVIFFRDYDGRMLCKCQECIEGRERAKMSNMSKNLVEGIN